MSKSENHIDQLFRDHLKDAEFPLDGSEWIRLSKDLHGANKPKGGWFFWVWLGLPMVLIAAALLWTSISNRHTDQPLAETKAVKETIDPGIAESMQPLDEGISDKKPQSDVTGNPVELSSRLDKEVSQPPANQDAEALVRTKPATASNSGQIDLVDDAAKNETPTWQDVAEPVATDRSLPSSLDQEIEAGNLDLPIELKTKMPVLDVGMALPEMAILSAPFEWKLPNIKPLGPSLEAYAGITCNVPSITGNAAVVDYRAQNEQAGLGFTVGANITAQKRTWKYGAGLSADVQQTQYNSQLKLLVYDSIPFIDQNLDTTWVPWNFRDTILDGSSISGPKRTYVGIPVFFGKSMKISPRLGVNAVVMVQPGVLVGASGQFQSGTGTLSNLTTDAYQPFKLQYGARIGVDYYWRRNILIFTELNYANDLTNQTRLNNVTERVQVSGMRVGLRFHLN